MGLKKVLRLHYDSNTIQESAFGSNTSLKVNEQVFLFYKLLLAKIRFC